MASGQNPKKYPTTELKSKLLRPALTSTYAVYFNVAEILGKSDEVRTFFNNRQANLESELLTLSCSEASLPGSSLATTEINNDYTGVTERHVYRRLYDDRTDFTFYVDYDYKVIKFFETWMSWIVGETQYTEQSKQTYNYRVKFPNDYNVNMHIQKFEKDFSNKIEYTFIGAYPISINSIPVSYDSSQLLKCTVSFTYKRYYLENVSQIIFGVDSRDSLVSIQDVPQGSRIIGSKDINNNQRQFQYLTPDGNILTTVDRIIR